MWCVCEEERERERERETAISKHTNSPALNRDGAKMGSSTERVELGVVVAAAVWRFRLCSIQQQFVFNTIFCVFEHL